jgi:hypothetical protein
MPYREARTWEQVHDIVNQTRLGLRCKLKRHAQEGDMERARKRLRKNTCTLL